METWGLLEKYVIENSDRENVSLCDYTINGSIIKCRYSIGCTSYDNILEIEILEYITWVYNLCNNK